MKLFGGIFAIILAALVVLGVNSFYVVRQDQQALLLQLGAIQEAKNTPDTDEPGLYFKLPFVQNVITLDKKNLGLTISDIQVLASDQRRLVVDAFVRWRIVDPVKFYQRLGNERRAESQLNRFTESAIREALGDSPVPEIVSGQRAVLMERIKSNVNRNMDDTGIQIIDIRIRQADLPQEIAEGVYDRMRTARQQVAQQTRAEGEEQARRIRAEADREAVVIEAQAREASEIIKGEGDAARTKIYAEAYGRDAEFFRFYRSLVACEAAIKQGTRLVVDPNNLDICNIFSVEAARAGRAR